MLYWRISRVFLALLLLVGACSFAIFSFYWLRFNDEATQRMNWELAEQLRPSLERFLGAQPQYDQLIEEIYRLETIRPDIDLYILSNEGAPLYAYGDRIETRRSNNMLSNRTIDLEPIQRFLDPSKAISLPLYGQDPLEPTEHRPFSAAPIQLGGTTGYLYLLFSSDRSLPFQEVLQESYVIKGLLFSLTIMLLCSAVVGLLAFRQLTRPLRETIAAVSAFSGGAFSARANEESPDEIGVLAKEFNAMADTIALQVEQLKEADELRRNLVANVSHDLRRPLTSMLGYLELLGEQSKESADSKSEYLEVVERNSRTLQRLAEDLFELSRLEAKERSPIFEAFSISDVVNDMIMRFRPAAEARGIALAQEEVSAVPYVHADPRMIELVLGNLLENALSHTPQGGRVVIFLSVENDSVLVSVEDSGSGIAAAEQELLFERFYRVQEPGGKSTSGMGLGLAIVKRIVELHDTSIKVRSAPGEGTTFTLRLQKAE